MTLEFAIKHCEDVADYDCFTDDQRKCSEEHRQLAGWLRELKERREKAQLSGEDATFDLISRQAAIDAFEPDHPVDWYTTMIVDVLEGLPSAQPVTHEERTKTHACDLISREAAIDLTYAETVNTNPEHFKSSEKFIGFMDDIDISDFGRWQWANGFNTALVATKIQLEKLPSAELRKKGKWIKFNNSCTIRCNQCGKEMTSLCDIQLPNYCPNCGSYNGGEEE